VKARPRAVLAMRPASLAENLFGPHRERLSMLVDLHPVVVTEFESAESHAALADAEILLAGWGCPRLDADELDRMPRLRGVVFAGGSAGALVDPLEAARRGIALTNTGEGNAQGVAEYTFATIVLAGKRARHAERLYRAERAHIDREALLGDTGNFGRTVGLIGASRIGRRVARLLATTDMRVLVYDPYADDDDVTALGAARVGLDELLTASDIVSVHAPALAETEHMIDDRALGLMRDGAVLLNTARGSLVDHEALRAHARSGRIEAILDVTDPEPLEPDDELWSLPNVTLTPHIAGATGNELHRLGRDAVDEVARYIAGHAFAGLERVPGAV